MKKMNGIPKGVVWFFGGMLVFAAFNYWLMGQVNRVVGDTVQKKKPVVVAAVPSGARVPVIDRENDLLAPVANVRSPHMYLKRRPQKNTEEKEYELPRTGTILAQ